MKTLSISCSIMPDHSNKIIQQQHINIFLESKLSKYDTSFTYRIKDFIIIRADEKNTMNPHYGIISYVDKIITILEIQSMSTEQFDTLYLNTTFKNKNISIFAIYSSPKNSYQQIQKHLIPIIHNEYSRNKDIILIGDFNIPYNSPIYMKLFVDLLKYNLQQHVNKYTTINNTTIDLIFTNLEIKKINTFFAHWSDRNMLQIQIIS